LESGADINISNYVNKQSWNILFESWN
jgi:hypothetical protein